MSFFNKFPTTEYDIFGRNLKSKIPDIFKQVRIVDKRFDSITPYRLLEIADQRPDQLSYELYGTTDFHWTFFIINNHLKYGHTDWPMTDKQFEEYVSEKYQGYAITGHRTVEDDMNLNSVQGFFAIGSTLSYDNAGTITPNAIVTARNAKVNQIAFKYTGNHVFTQTENIYGPNTTFFGNPEGTGFTIRPYAESVHHYEDEDGNLISNFENYRLPLREISYYDYEKRMNDERRSIRVLKREYIEDFSIEFRKAVNA